ncbi:metal ABC transporter ATP-binding protein [Xylocopilactobacillus apicola]|uniref:ABC transporter ATP-binding protein n=1 Tax=Xylocopilactobacillus apicola TaxID=2932184 RepID=A0AAU9CYD3_9LACO|nr:ATP-binding cassette domain-containing protein [Xylocopilactobacillus apicola]BDR59032.1 ABC transporter ATP-binding protein [Xylocopilactobacillus apicola]
MSEKQTLIKLVDLSMSFDQKLLFKNLNLEIKQGDFLSIIGPNGTGKSTLIQLMMKELAPRSGQVIYTDNGFDRKKIGFVPQTRNINEDYPLNLTSFVSLRLYDNLIPWLTKKDRLKISTALKKVRLQDKSDNLLANSSGGEQQRAYIAQALVHDPKMIILDEPTNGLDERSKKEVMEILKKLQVEDQVTIVLVTHDPESVIQNSTKILKLNGDGTFEVGDQSLLENNDVEF